MPPKVKITKEMIIDAAFCIARTEGANKITARRISEQLQCSTHPILYHYASVEEIKREVYQKADEYHNAYLMKSEEGSDDPMLAIGINYVKFAIEESHLFRFLFQSNGFSDSNMLELMDTEELNPIISAEAKEIFSMLFIYIHGYASLYANNSMVYDEKALITTLNKVFYGAVYAAKEVNDEETI